MTSSGGIIRADSGREVAIATELRAGTDDTTRMVQVMSEGRRLGLFLLVLGREEEEDHSLQGLSSRNGTGKRSACV